MPRMLCLNFQQNRISFRHFCPRNTIFITNVSEKIPPLMYLLDGSTSLLKILRGIQ